MSAHLHSAPPPPPILATTNGGSVGGECKVEIKLKQTKEGEKKGTAKVGVMTTKYAKERRNANVHV